MKEKFYFEIGDEEECFPLDYFQDRINDGEEKISLELAKRDYKSGFMWCKDQGEFVEQGSGDCGRGCEFYSPCNGKSGRCKLLVNTFVGNGETFILDKKGLRITL